MNRKINEDFLVFLRKMSKKGFYHVLNHINENENVHYNDVLKYCIDKKIVVGRATVTIILNGLTDLGLLERMVSQTRPLRTTYKISKKGSIVIKNLKELESIFN